jgi:hypothetical protein
MEVAKLILTAIGSGIVLGTIIFYVGRWMGRVSTSVEILTELARETHTTAVAHGNSLTNHDARINALESSRPRRKK